MPKLRNGETVLEQFGQWIARKCRNHNPLEELSVTKTEAQRLPGQYRPKTRPTVGMLRNEEQHERATVVYRAGDRCFLITAMEVDPAMIDDAMVENAGY